jgi:hypothetical protein
MTRRIAAVTVATMIAILALTGLAHAAFRVTEFSGALASPIGEPLTQAGGHPDVTTNIVFAKTIGEGGVEVVDENVKDVDVTLPPGLVGNPTATPKCSQADLLGNGYVSRCAPETQIGIAHIDICNGGCSHEERGLYNMEPPPGVPGQFGFNFGGVLVFVDATVGNDGEYVLEAKASGISQSLPVGGTSLTFWGVPADPSHTAERRKGFETGLPSSAPRLPFMSNPSVCDGAPLKTFGRADSWEKPDVFQEMSYDHDTSGNPLIITGCDSVPFNASIVAQPTTQAADSPTGLNVTVAIPQPQNPDGLSTADLKQAVVALPFGLAVNPASADGLQACSTEQIDLDSTEPARCPDSSKIGAVEIDTPLLEAPLQGSVFLAAQHANPFGSLLAIYLVAEGNGVVIKLPGRITSDPATGQTTATFDRTPQLPFERLHVELFGGPRAALVTPPTCGTYSTAASFTPWSGTPPVNSTSSFQITSGPNGSACPNGSFDPKLSAGTTNPVGGKYSPFVLDLSREDGTQQLSTIAATLPEGLLGKLAGVPYCPDSALGGIPTAEGTGAAQLASPSCPAASQVGTVSVGAGAGPSPFYVNTGKVYLAGPYKGAPLSLAIVTPALAGPFDLGNVVVRSALEVDPTTTQITAVTDPLPTILHGIPLDLRSVAVSINREGFTLNPTSCEPMVVTSTITGTAGASASPQSRFQVASCERLAFKPKLALSLRGGTTRAKNPALKAVLTAPAGQANIGRVAVILPKSEFIDNRHIGDTCTRVQFNAGAGNGAQCPAKSVLGKATAYSPLLAKPLKGKVYFRSNGGERELPDLVASLDGQIHVNLVGFIDSVHRKGSEVSRTRNTFAAVPDAPVSKFILELSGGKKGLLQNATNLCKSTNRATVKMIGQNGKSHDFNPVVKVGCGGKSKPKK